MNSRILIDTNVWRVLTDADAVEPLRSMAKAEGAQILVAPAVVYEMLRTPDPELRRRQIKAVTLGSWKRLMTEVFHECEDLRAVIGKRRPEWLLEEPDRARFFKLRGDWVGGRGFWWRARQDPAREASYLQSLEGNLLSLARAEAHERRGPDPVRWTGAVYAASGGWSSSPWVSVCLFS